MTVKPVLSRENFRFVREKILRTLQQHGFRPQARNRPDPDQLAITRIIEAACRITAEVAPDKDKAFEPTPTHLDGKKMNRMVIDVAIVMAQSGIPGMETNAALNDLWLLLCDLLGELGYENPLTHLAAPNEPQQVPWKNYAKWRDIVVPANRPIQKQA